MSKSQPQQPAPVDPNAAASAQAKSDAGTATANTLLQNPDYISAYGTQKTTQTGSYTMTAPDGSTYTVPTFTNTTTLSPGQQALYDQNTHLGIKENSIANEALTSAQATLANPLTASSFAPIQTSLGLQTGYDAGPALKTSYDSGGPIQSSVGYDTANRNIPTTFADTKDQVQGSLGNTDFTADRDAATKAILDRLAPTIASGNRSLASTLANQGVTQNSAAWNAADLQNQSKTNDLYLGAITTGDQEQQAGFDQRLASGQYGLAAQQQEYEQAAGRGAFAQAGTEASNAAVAQDNAARLAAAQYGLAAQGQQNAQNAAGAGFFNTAAGQQNAQNAGAAGFYNSALTAGATFGNEAQQEQYTEGLGLNSNTINQIDALRSGGQVTAPNFPGYTAGTLDQTPINSDIYSTAGLNQSAYNTAAGLDAANNTALANVASSIFGAAGNIYGSKTPSDRRLKRDIERVGTARNGLPIYLFRYKSGPEWCLGFMADEVAQIHPDAVANDERGFAMVDYDRAVA